MGQVSKFAGKVPSLLSLKYSSMDFNLGIGGPLGAKKNKIVRIYRLKVSINDKDDQQNSYMANIDHCAPAFEQQQQQNLQLSEQKKRVQELKLISLVDNLKY